MGPKLDDFIHRRTTGDAIKRVARRCREANDKGYSPLLIIDEPQYGASDRFVEGRRWRRARPCVLVQIFDAIDDALGDDAKDRVFIGLSATPYELHGINSVWKVNQYLTSSYRGFNYFGGKVIDAEADVDPPRTMTFQRTRKRARPSIPRECLMQAYEAHPHVFARFADRIGFEENQEHYRRAVEETLREVILQLAEEGGALTGICIRLCNNNLRSHRLLTNFSIFLTMRSRSSNISATTIKA